MVGRTDANAEKPNVSTTSRAKGIYTEAGRATASVRRFRQTDPLCCRASYGDGLDE